AKSFEVDDAFAFFGEAEEDLGVLEDLGSGRRGQRLVAVRAARCEIDNRLVPDQDVAGFEHAAQLAGPARVAAAAFLAALFPGEADRPVDRPLEAQRRLARELEAGAFELGDAAQRFLSGPGDQRQPRGDQDLAVDLLELLGGRLAIADRTAGE